MVLADMGAEVIRVEDPSYPYASIPPFYKKGRYTESAFNNILMRNKKSITLNLHNSQALPVLYKLIETADVVLESFRPGVTKKLAIDYDTLKARKPELIYCSLTGYGQTGPYSQLPGHDMNYMAISGMLDLNQDRIPCVDTASQRKESNSNPNHLIVPCVQAADVGGALFAAVGILGALYQRLAEKRHSSNNDEQEGLSGQYIDISMLDCAFAFNPMVSAYHFTKNNKHENPLQGDFPYYSIYRTKDNKFLTVGNIEVKFWHQFCEALNLGELKSMQFARGHEREDVFQKIQDSLLSKTQSEWMEIFRKFDTCVMPVNDFDAACKDPQINAREMLVELDHAYLGKVQNIASPIKYSRTPIKEYQQAPLPGDHTHEIMHALGYSEEEIHHLQTVGIFR
jgi:crotonobetainyl-CoA:carnitine CoA-transferase CaiB-like acyl-CoA transferase